ncbi:hypothetical protein [Actinoplanes sp. G11-F43]|uniref:hypothetical protein n=1 Tax=Actinoplanes sp. G11-F43 TaxID=3424130 RepID=UPI003D32939B
MRKSRNKTGSRALRAGVAVTATTAAVVAGTALPAYAAAFVLSTTQISATGGTPVTLYGGSALAGKGVRFVPNATTCPTAYDTVDATSPAAGALVGSTTKAWVSSPAGLTLGSTYKLCLYADAASGAAYATDSTTDTMVVVNIGNLSTTTGNANSRPTISVTGANYATNATFASQFISGATTCPTTYQATGVANIAAATSRTSATSVTVTVPTLVAGTPYLVCTYNGSTVNSSTLQIRASSTFTTAPTPALPAATISPASGSSGVATNILVNAPSTNTSLFTGTPEVLITRNSCLTTRPTNASLITPAGWETTAAATTKITNAKLAVAVPTSTVNAHGDVTTPYSVCVYASNSSGSALLASPITYAVAPLLTVADATTRFQVGSQVSPTTTASGPSQGGSTITVTGLTGIPSQASVDGGATLAATLGGSPLTGIKVIDATSFTGVTSARAPGVVKLAVTTAAGTVTAPTARYTYTYGITTVPNTATQGSAPVLDITGAGFSALTFADPTCTGGPPVTSCATPAADKSYVLLTDNSWNGQTFGASVLAWNSTHTGTAFCRNVLPISDEELICTMDLANKIDAVAGTSPFAATLSGTAVPAGTYTVTVVNDADGLESGEFSIQSSGSTFTVAPF